MDGRSEPSQKRENAMQAPKFFFHCASNGDYLRVNGNLVAFESREDLHEFHRLRHYQPQGFPSEAASQPELLDTLRHYRSKGCLSVALYRAGGAEPDFEFLPMESVLPA
jgi:hypothetical protein